MAARNQWTDEEMATLERLWRRGATDREIAAALGTRSPSAVESRREYMGLTKAGAGTPSKKDLEERPAISKRSDRPDLMAIWERWNERLRERLRAQGELIE